MAVAVSQSEHPQVDSEWTPTSIGPTSFLTFAKSIKKPFQDERQYRVIRLANGLQAMLVHDSKADKAAASLDVAVGHLWDPVSHCTFRW